MSNLVKYKQDILEYFINHASDHEWNELKYKPHSHSIGDSNNSNNNYICNHSFTHLLQFNSNSIYHEFVPLTQYARDISDIGRRWNKHYRVWQGFMRSHHEQKAEYNIAISAVKPEIESFIRLQNETHRNVIFGKYKDMNKDSVLVTLSEYKCSAFIKENVINLKETINIKLDSCRYDILYLQNLTKQIHKCTLFEIPHSGQRNILRYLLFMFFSLQNGGDMYLEIRNTELLYDIWFHQWIYMLNYSFGKIYLTSIDSKLYFIFRNYKVSYFKAISISMLYRCLEKDVIYSFIQYESIPQVFWDKYKLCINSYFKWTHDHVTWKKQVQENYYDCKHFGIEKDYFTTFIHSPCVMDIV
jgi:hypothetical protein